MILYIMTAGAFPFTEATARCELFQSLANKQFQFPERMSPELKDLLLRMWDINPEQRIKIPEVRSLSRPDSCTDFSFSRSESTHGSIWARRFQCQSVKVWTQWMTNNGRGT